AAPTTSWAPGEVIFDAHRLILPASLRPGGYTLIAGLYDEQTMKRVPVGSQDHLPLARVEIRT
ncbi:MAG: hypothetical protein KGJ86_07075, partial [Chloroflexota bacterium]|nr:hypothetical protein [Chloroflexota bacterium]